MRIEINGSEVSIVTDDRLDVDTLGALLGHQDICSALGLEDLSNEFISTVGWAYFDDTKGILALEAAFDERGVPMEALGEEDENE